MKLLAPVPPRATDNVPEVITVASRVVVPAAVSRHCASTVKVGTSVLPP